MSSPARWLLLALLPSCAGRSVHEMWMPEGAISRVEVDADAGDVVLQIGPTLRVESTLSGLQVARTVSHRVADGVLTLEGRCVPLLPCAVDTTLDVPEGVPVSIRLGSGDVHATGVSALTLSLGTGSAVLAADGPVSADVGVGDVQIRPEPGVESRVTVAHGDVRAEVSEDGWTATVAASELLLDGVREAREGASHLDLVAPSGKVTVTRVASVAGR